MSANSTTQVVSQESKSASSNRTASGSSTPGKNEKAKARTSPAKSSPKSSLATAKKTTRASLQNKSPEDLCSQIIELKKSLASVTDEKNSLKTKLRRLEDENNKKSESERNSTNSTVNNFKRKIQRLETLLKDKESVIKKLQNDVKVAKQGVVKRMPESPIEKLPGKRSQGSSQENTRPTPTKSHTPSRSPLGRKATPNKGHEQFEVIVEENKQLKSWLRRALDIDRVNNGEKYEEMNQMELIAEIHRLTEELRLVQKVNEESRTTQESATSVEPPADWKAKGIIVAEELEKLKAELVKLKEDRASYYKAMESKDMELTKVLEAMKKVQKDFLDAKEKPERTRPSTFVRKPSTQAGPSGKASSGRSAATSAALQKPNAQTRGALPSNPKPSTESESPAKRASNGKPRLSVTTTLAKQANATITKSSTVVIKKASKSKPTASGSPTTPAASPAAASTQKSEAAADGQARVNEKEIEAFRENLAAKKIQTTWKKHQASDQQQEEPARVNGIGKEAKLQDFRENRAAKVIQKGWKASREKSRKGDELDEAVVTIQSAARGHSQRTQYLAAMKGASGDGDATDSDLDASATIIQSAARAHYAREEMLQKWERAQGNGDCLHDGTVPS